MKLLFKRQSLAYILCFTLTLLLFSCSTSNDELDETQRIESQLEFKSVSPEELNALIQIQKQDEAQSQSRNSFSSRDRNCDPENLHIYWTGAAKLDGINDPVAALAEREIVRSFFETNYSLVTVLGSFPNETNVEFWVFGTRNSNSTGGCHGNDVLTAINNNENTSTEDDE